MNTVLLDLGHTQYLLLKGDTFRTEVEESRAIS